MRVYKNKSFAKFARKEGLNDATLCAVIQDAEAGQIDADYGGGVLKQRLARPNAGKSGGYRSIILFRHGGNAFFVYGFAKSDRENIDAGEVRAFKDLAAQVFRLDVSEIEKLVKNGTYQEVQCDE